ncbi:hypothetical protein ABW20_dc0103699 [Dactylellina cionopaga]|nr:hypothetical protein ABW20_dc0103699 [Dactylellina cionopaga]
MLSLAQCTAKLKSIRFDESCKKFGPWMPIVWFWDDETIKKLKPVLQNLSVLGLNISTKTDGRSLEGVEDLVTRFMTDVASQIKTLSVVFDDILVEYNSDPIVCRRNPLDLAKLQFTSLRKLHLDTHALLEGDLRGFLLSHKETLRHVSLHNCLLQQSDDQIWSNIFKLLQSDLSLETFEYDVDPNPRNSESHSAEFFYQIKYVSWFRVYGDVRTNAHQCELLPKEMKSENAHRIKFGDAILVITKLEDMILESPTMEVPTNETTQQSYMRQLLELEMQNMRRFMLVSTNSDDRYKRLKLRPEKVKEAIISVLGKDRIG